MAEGNTFTNLKSLPDEVKRIKHFREKKKNHTVTPTPFWLGLCIAFVKHTLVLLKCFILFIVFKHVLLCLLWDRLF